MGALAEKIISPGKKILSTGSISIPNPYFPDQPTIFRDWKAHGWVDMRMAIAVSSDVYFYEVGGGYGDQKGLGPTKIKKYLELFGWGNITKVDLPGEAQGLIPSPEWKKEVKKEGWWDGDTYNMAIGQGNILATPLQVASAFVAIANGGKLFQPEIVQKIIGGEEIKPKIIREIFIDPENLQCGLI